MVKIVSAHRADLAAARVAEIDDLLCAAFGECFEGYWDDIGPALNFMAVADEDVVAHACVVERQLHTQGHELTTGYVEAVACRPQLQRRGYGTAVMEAVTSFVTLRYALGGLST